MHLPFHLPARAAILALAALVLLALPTTSAEASGSGCKHVSLGVSKRTVPTGGSWMRVHGSTCRAAHPHWVRVRMRGPNGWRKVGVARTNSAGRFSKRVHLKVSARRRVTRIQAKAVKVTSKPVPLVVETTTQPLTGSGQPASSSSCALSSAGSQIDLTAPGCKVLFDDTSTTKNPIGKWGRIDCGVWPDLDPTRAGQFGSGGDTHLTATGASQGDDDYRRLTVFDGDDVAGERCELGENDNVEGPTALYREGDRRATFASLRLPGNFPLDAETWQTVLQMKQAQPAANGGGVPILEMQAWDNHFWVSSDKETYFSFPATKDVWTRFVFDVTYSQDPSKGSVQVAVDLNDDGDVSDAGERSPRIKAATLKTETAGGGPDTIAPGESIPSHLRVGLYHDPSVPCPVSTGGCSTEVDNVQVLAP